MDTSDAIAALAAAFAAASALYARHAVGVAKTANKISIHNERLKIYKNLLSYHAHLASRGISVTEQQLWAFHETAQLAEFYFTNEHASSFESIFNDSLRLFSLRDTWETAKEEQSQEEYQKLVRDTHQLHRATRDRCSELADSIKPALQIGRP